MAVTEALFIPCSMLCGFGLDMLLGDPEKMPHPVRGMGKMILLGERLLAAPAAGRGKAYERAAGGLLAAFAAGAVLTASAAVLWLSFYIHPALAFIVCTIMFWQCISVRCLADYAKNVLRFLKAGDLPGARRALAMIVGRDVDALDEDGICKGAVETVAENTNDGVVAPMFYMALLGPCGGMVYKMINTLDSMIGYKNERYLEFGRAAARLDDFAGFVPARLTALLMIAAVIVLGLDGRGALRIWRRDRGKHPSPNSAQSEAVMAGALGVALAGGAAYDGEYVPKPAIGDAGRPIAADDIKTATRLLYCTSCLFLPAAFFINMGISMLVFRLGWSWS